MSLSRIARHRQVPRHVKFSQAEIRSIKVDKRDKSGRLCNRRGLTLLVFLRSPTRGKKPTDGNTASLGLCPTCLRETPTPYRRWSDLATTEFSSDFFLFLSEISREYSCCSIKTYRHICSLKLSHYFRVRLVAIPMMAIYSLDRLPDLTASLVSSVGEDMREERWTDLVLYSTEGAPVPVHRAVLSQSPHLRPLLRSLSCCQAGCYTLSHWSRSNEPLL